MQALGTPDSRQAAQAQLECPGTALGRLQVRVPYIFNTFGGINRSFSRGKCRVDLDMQWALKLELADSMFVFDVQKVQLMVASGPHAGLEQVAGHRSQKRPLLQHYRS